MKTGKICNLVISIIILGLGFIIVYPDKAQLCQNGDLECISRFPIFELGEPLLIGGLMGLLPTSVALLFVRQDVFKSWSKFALVAIPLMVLLIILAPAQGVGSIPAMSIPGGDKESMAWLVSILFLVISLIVVLVKSLKKSN